MKSGEANTLQTSLCYPVACLLLFIVFLTSIVNCFDPENDFTSNQQQLFPSSKESSAIKIQDFWQDVRGEEYISKLNSFNLETFLGNYSDTFIMFYANWCKFSKESKDEFASAAEEIAYTEGFSHVRFGALDCNATMSNKRICNKTFKVTRYPRFLYFKNGHVNRMFPIDDCPRLSDNFYNWVVHKEEGKFCSGSMRWAMSTSTSSKRASIVSGITAFVAIVSFLYAGH